MYLLMTSAYESRPYRPCVGILLFNPKGFVWVGKRLGGLELTADDGDKVWQMPQGGVDRGEDPLDAAYRELYEETGIRSVKLIRESSQWVKYDLPKKTNATGWRRRYRGQTQKWFAFSFEGSEREINIAAPDGHDPEFSDWKWVSMTRLPDLVVSFKRDVYEQVVQEFMDLAPLKHAT
jgi:putative (di)nucleoside polyphosphate hydrolase